MAQLYKIEMYQEIETLQYKDLPWWHQDMNSVSTLLALCAGKALDFPHKWHVMHGF